MNASKATFEISSRTIFGIAVPSDAGLLFVPSRPPETLDEIRFFLIVEGPMTATDQFSKQTIRVARLRYHYFGVILAETYVDLGTLDALDLFESHDSLVGQTVANKLHAA